MNATPISSDETSPRRRPDERGSTPARKDRAREREKSERPRMWELEFGRGGTILCGFLLSGSENTLRGRHIRDPESGDSHTHRLGAPFFLIDSRIPYRKERPFISLPTIYRKRTAASIQFQRHPHRMPTERENERDKTVPVDHYGRLLSNGGGHSIIRTPGSSARPNATFYHMNSVPD